MSLLCNLTSLLVFLATIDVVFGTITCYGPGYFDNQQRFYEHFHEGLNLTFTCEAFMAAVGAAQSHSEGKEDNINTDEWCKYSRNTWSKWIYRDDWLQNTVLKEMDWNLGVHAALLHPYTEYGCGATEYGGISYMYYYLVCIYKKTSNNPCYIEFTYPK
ncbi:hypothetical protein Q1695_001733 [Nippostrongylus brasiliensis]|nr:hypothetical protein Q1695_001733 [Nippostrongylus brasiliensis]